jgi:hypothetical protein
MPRENRFTIYDALEKTGLFDQNPANTYARDKTTGATLYAGPVEYPKMLYSPSGEERIVVPAEVISTPMGPKEVGEQKELVHQVVTSREEEEALLTEGWHDHPAKAIKARIEAGIAAGTLDKSALRKIPLMGSDERIKTLEAEIARLTGLRAVDAAARGETTSDEKAPAPKNKVA